MSRPHHPILAPRRAHDQRLTALCLIRASHDATVAVLDDAVAARQHILWIQATQTQARRFGARLPTFQTACDGLLQPALTVVEPLQLQVEPAPGMDAL